MSLSTNIIQRNESFFMLPAVNWRNTFSTTWRQHKEIIFVLSVIRCSSLFNRGLYHHVDTWLGSLRDRIPCRITESVPLLPIRFMPRKNLTTEYSQLHCPWLTVRLSWLSILYRVFLHYIYIHAQCSMTPWNRPKSNFSLLFNLKSPSFPSLPLKDSKIADHNLITTP